MPCSKCNETDKKFPKYRKKLPSGVHKMVRNGRVCTECKDKDRYAYYATFRPMVFKHYGNKCRCCGEKNELFLTIDHVNNDGNKEVWPSGKRITGWLLYTRIVRDNYPSTYQLLCMNCNFGKRMNGGTCPHISQNVI